MKFLQPLIPGNLIKRYKRFLADIQLESGKIITAHCPNSGSMLSCSDPGMDVLLSFHENPKRKYAYTWEMVKVNSVWVGINTMLPNKLVAEAIELGKIKELAGYDKIFKEKKVSANSRLDLMLQRKDETCFIEIKNVTLMENQAALFPDAVTSRGTKHLQELIKLKLAGNRAVIFFLIQRIDCELFKPADNVDPVYGQSLREAFAFGVEILPYRAFVFPHEIFLDRKLDFEL